MVKELVRPYYKQRCANATKDSVGAACWRIGRNTRRKCMLHTMCRIKNEAIYSVGPVHKQFQTSLLEVRITNICISVRGRLHVQQY